MQIPVSLVVNLVANGKPVEEILEEYPDLEAEDIRQSFNQNNLTPTKQLFARKALHQLGIH